MIEESYVSFDTARMLKEAGFDEVCRSAYYATGNSAVMHERNSMLSPGYISRPTQALAARWLREAHGIMIVSFFDDYMSKWYYVIDGVKKQSGIKCVQSASDYDNYETALEARLREAIKMVKK